MHLIVIIHTNAEFPPRNPFRLCHDGLPRRELEKLIHGVETRKHSQQEEKAYWDYGVAFELLTLDMFQASKNKSKKNRDSLQYN